MIRNFKVLGLALVAICALGATMASAASAAAKITSDGPVTLIGTQTGETSANQLSAFGSTVHCSSVTYTGHKAAVTPHELIPSGAEKATITPHYSGCTDGAGHPATIKMTSCDFTFTLGTLVAGTAPITADFECSTPGDTAHVEVYSDAGHTTRICTITFSAQTVSGGSVSDTTNGKLDITGTFTGITATREGVCLLDGKGTSTSSATLSADVLVEGRNSAGGVTGISLS